MSSENCSGTEDESDKISFYSTNSFDEIVKELSAKATNWTKQEIKDIMAKVGKLTGNWTEELAERLVELISRDGSGTSQGVMLSVIPSVMLSFNKRVLLLYLNMLNEVGWENTNEVLDNIKSAFNDTVIEYLKKNGKRILKQMNDDSDMLSYIG